MPRKSAAQAKSGLPFKEINSKLGNEELIKRLKACALLLGDWEVLDDTQTHDLTDLAITLVSPALRLHKNKDVCLFNACCHAQLIRLFHPTPPYTEDELKSVLSLFIGQLKGLQNPSGASFKWQFGLLDLLLDMKAFSLLLHVDAQDLLLDLFKMVFSIINNQQSSHVKLHLRDVLVSILQEGESFTHELMDTILRNVLEPIKSKNAPLYEFSCQLISKSSTFLEPYINLFFSSVMVDGQTSESELSDRLYDILFELHSIEPNILFSVLPQLEYKLLSVDTEERLSFTKVLARMFSAKYSKLSIENRHLWNSFLGRFQDASSSVRLECVRYSRYFLVYHPNLVNDTTAKLSDRLRDSDEKVRLEAVKTVCEVATESLASVSAKLIEALQDRMRDKKLLVRKEAIMSLARLYRHVTSGDESIGKSQKDKLMWVPNKLLHCFYQMFPDDRLLIERCLLTCIVPVTLPEKEKVERLLSVYAGLDDHASKAFEEIMRNRKQMRNNMIALIEAHLDTSIKGHEKEQLMLTRIIPIARCLPDVTRSQSHLKSLMKMVDEDEFKLKLQQCLDVTASYKDSTEAKADVLNKIGSKHFIADTIKGLLDKCCPLIVDRECVRVMAERVTHELCEPSLSESEEDERAEFEHCKRGFSLLKVLSSLEPLLFHHVDIFECLLGVLRHEDREVVDNCLGILNSVGSIIGEESPQVAGCLQPELVKLSQRGHPHHAKLAVRCINVTFREPRTILERLFNSLVSNLNYSHKHLQTVMMSLGEIAQLQPSLFQTEKKKIIREFVVQDLLTVDRGEQRFSKKQKEWCEDEKVTVETRYKVCGVKLLVKWLLGLKDDQQKSAVPVLRILTSVLENDGDLQGNNNMSAPDRSRMRAAAACGLLKLARHSSYVDCFSLEQFQQLALVMQDTCEQVRDRFASKLHKGLRSMELPVSYLSFFSLAAVEPRADKRNTYCQMLTRNIQIRREFYTLHTRTKDRTPSVLPEYALSHTVHLLSHHPTFRRIDTEVLDTFNACLWFFLKPMVHKADNYGFLYKLLESIKQTLDAQDPENIESSKNMYAVCDLAIGVLSSRMTHITDGNFSGKVLLPKKLFKSRGQDVPVNDIRYLPHNYKFNTDKTERPTWPTTKATPTKKRSPPKRKRAPNSSVDTSLSDIELTPSPSKRNKGSKHSPKKYRQTKITSQLARSVKRKVFEEKNEKMDETLEEGRKQKEQADKENETAMEAEENDRHAHTEESGPSSKSPAAAAATTTTSCSRLRRGRKRRNPVKEEEAEEGVVKRKVVKEKEEDNDEIKNDQSHTASSPVNTEPPPPTTNIQRKARSRRRR